MNDQTSGTPDGPMVSAAAHLVWHRPTCSACGLTDWTVSVTEPDGRKLHVQCWRESR